MTMAENRLMVRLCLLAIMLCGVTTVWLPLSAQAQTPLPARSIQKPSYLAADGSVRKPAGANPYLALLPAGASPDYGHWRAWLQQQAQRRAAGRAGPAKRLDLSESEPNDNQATANVVGGFGSSAGEDAAADISGTAASPPAATLTQAAEDEGSIPLATVTGLTAGNAVRVAGTIGDGPFGNAAGASGDFDFYRIGGVQAGQAILIDVDTPLPGEGLDSYVALYDSSGTLLQINDDDGGSTDSFLLVTAPAADDYFLSVGGFSLTLSTLGDPFDSSSGLTFGLGSEGDYEVTIGLDYGDKDYFSIELKAGDVLGVTGNGAIAQVQLFDADAVERVGSSQDASFLYPAASPLPGGGNAALAYLIESPGSYAINAFGLSGDYALQLRVFRPGLEQSAVGEHQILFLDFDGATIDPDIFNVGAIPGPVTLSPLVDFLPGWGLSATDENAVIDAILATVQENIDSDLRTLGNNPNFDVEIRNSRDHPDPFGEPSVSRVIIGGSISELGIFTIGIAQSIDVGNYETRETGVVLLDLLSLSDFDPNSLNSIALADGVGIIDLIGTGVGNLTAHEAGHFWGNFHTENFLTLPTIMDQGGNLENSVGIGFDGTFGNEDDVDVDFDVDFYTTGEGFSGIEDTRNTTAFGLTTGTGIAVPEPAGELTGNGTFPATPVGQISAGQSFTLTSSGSADLTIAAAAALDDATYFILQNNSCTDGLNLGTGASCSAAISCAPQIEGGQTTTLRIATNAGEFSRVLDCTGLPEPVLSEPIFSAQFE